MLKVPSLHLGQIVKQCVQGFFPRISVRNCARSYLPLILVRNCAQSFFLSYWSDSQNLCPECPPPHLGQKLCPKLPRCHFVKKCAQSFPPLILLRNCAPPPHTCVYIYIYIDIRIRTTPSLHFVLKGVQTFCNNTARTSCNNTARRRLSASLPHYRIIEPSSCG